ncbi:MAG: hypothetical protein AAF665_06335 [Pseudomonadota bacterium]
MIDDTTAVGEKTEILRQKMEKHLGINARSFEAAVRRAGRQLPRRMRKKAALVIEAQALSEHPKLARRIDLPGFETAAVDLQIYLESQKLSEQVWTRRLNRLALLAFNLLLIAGVTVAFMRWRGLI